MNVNILVGYLQFAITNISADRENESIIFFSVTLAIASSFDSFMHCKTPSELFSLSVLISETLHRTHFILSSIKPESVSNRPNSNSPTDCKCVSSKSSRFAPSTCVSFTSKKPLGNSKFIPLCLLCLMNIKSPSSVIGTITTPPTF